MMRRRAAICGAYLLWALSAAGQADSRVREIEAKRQAKAVALAPVKTSAVDRIFQDVPAPRLLRKLLGEGDGLRLKTGGLPTGSGFAAGPEYFRPGLFGKAVSFRASAVGSTALYYRLETQLSAPSLENGRMSGSLKAIRSDFTQLNYYGPGARSSLDDRTTYRLERTSFEGTFGFRPARRTQVGTGMGYVWFNVGPGTAPDWPSSGQRFSPATTPGIREQSNFLVSRIFAQLDTRDDDLDPRRGMRVRSEFSLYSDRRRSAYSFTRLDADVERYYSFLSGLRGIALHGRIQLANALAGQQVPFYLQPTLGGADDLRGYPAFRFYANNTVVLNAEYRWTLFHNLSAAVFTDMGKALLRISAWRDSPWRMSYGAGIRLNARPMFLRVDVGFSSEGVQMWLKFENIFQLF